MHLSLSGLGILVVAGVLAGPVPLHAQSAEDFYSGKQIRLIVGSAAGDGYDIWARLIARHMGRHVPGRATIIVQNMPGAGTITAANHLFNVAPGGKFRYVVFNARW